ncbi:unnamed protein product [Soboliphyme baturini]|uniref:Uncharacterized protein n=1 Tax=Soboliphyme baturini TaxID=241478 RepID=A0A183IEA9_9BILA|nr:unnamed protein product [Soboliphyme baturini]
MSSHIVIRHTSQKYIASSSFSKLDSIQIKPSVPWLSHGLFPMQLKRRSDLAAPVHHLSRQLSNGPEHTALEGAVGLPRLLRITPRGQSTVAWTEPVAVAHAPTDGWTRTTGCHRGGACGHTPLARLLQ